MTGTATSNAPTPPASFLTPAPLDVATGDVDGDGDGDLVTAPTGLWLNDGSGRFTNAANQLLATNIGRAVDLGDVDGDGDLDLVVATGPGERPALWTNDGTGRFLTAFTLPPTGDRAQDVRFADLDGDGDKDIVVAFATSNPGRSGVFINQRAGVFTNESATRLSSTPGFARSIHTGDLDHDGDLDIIFANDRPDPPAVFLNDGLGSFTVAPPGYIPFVAGPHDRLHLFDFDGDGDLDLAAASAPSMTSNGMRVYENQGANFVLSPQVVDGLLTPWVLTSGDVDGDGDVDLFASRLLTNCTRQIQVPTLAFSGGALEIQHYARRAAAVGNHTAVALLAAGLLPAPVSTPWGRLSIDPSLMLTLPPIAVPLPSGSALQSIPIPVNPGFFGVQIHLQALSFADADPLGTLRLTNTLSETLR